MRPLPPRLPIVASGGLSLSIALPRPPMQAAVEPCLDELQYGDERRRCGILAPQLTEALRLDASHPGARRLLDEPQGFAEGGR